jgi:hypothetical protein
MLSDDTQTTKYNTAFSCWFHFTHQEFWRSQSISFITTTKPPFLKGIFDRSLCFHYQHSILSKSVAYQLFCASPTRNLHFRCRVTILLEVDSGRYDVEKREGEHFLLPSDDGNRAVRRNNSIPGYLSIWSLWRGQSARKPIAVVQVGFATRHSSFLIVVHANLGHDNKRNVFHVAGGWQGRNDNWSTAKSN